MKKITLNWRSVILLTLSGSMVAVYWFWVNQKLIGGANLAFGLGSYFALMSAATAFFPLPANLIVLGAAKAYGALLVAFVGGLATIVAFLAEYVFFTFLFKIKKVANFKNNWLYKKAAPIFDRHRFFILSFVSFLPIPSEPIRIYAITTNYSKILFPLAGFVGRCPRYFLLVYFGKEYTDSVWFLLGVLIFPGLFLLLLKGIASLAEILQSRRRTKDLGPDIAATSSLASASSEIQDSNIAEK